MVQSQDDRYGKDTRRHGALRHLLRGVPLLRQDVQGVRFGGQGPEEEEQVGLQAAHLLLRGAGLGPLQSVRRVPVQEACPEAFSYNPHGLPPTAKDEKKLDNVCLLDRDRHRCFALLTDGVVAEEAPLGFLPNRFLRDNRSWDKPLGRLARK